ncbi:protease3 [Salinivirga cyanobacteriivorans]|uniref:Protease3 n=1 Tax=Salinivirga cyanobacteriivorans TaxID=1307839 RepID=A0A0S2HX26_9BACT|nr:pitrilysin family protein [Salinivirga cyanobacteriivorans]ALO14584.1 protease3 [Salinivirga cyanobacteriivorans]
MNLVKSTFFTHQFKNGVRLIHLPSTSSVAHCGVVINTGTRDELPNEHGMAHLLEHMAFKGTKNRKAFHIIGRIEDVGGEIDAYTTKELTCFYTSFLNRHYKRTFELLADITFNAVYPERELEKEKNVVLEEIQMYNDSPSELIFDDFEEALFSHHPIGRNILGTPESVKAISREDIRNFRSRMYNTDQMVICSVGNIKPEQLVKWGEYYFESQPESIREMRRTAVGGSKLFSTTVDKDTNQAHCITGIEAYHHAHQKRYTLRLIANMLAGPAMNTRLNRDMRENKGLVYHVEAFYAAYSDSGLLGIYFGTDKAKVDRSLAAIARAFKKLREHKPGTLQMSRARNQLMGQIAIASENSSNRMLAMGKNMLFFNTSNTTREIIDRIDRITADDVWEVSNELLHPDKFSTLIYK